MNVNNLTRAELADFAKNAATQVAAGKVTGLLAEQALAISEALMSEADELAELDQQQVAIRAASIEITRKARDKSVRVSRLLQSLKYGMKSVRSPAAQFDAVGFDPPVRTRQIVTPQTPSELAVTGYSNGVNSLRFVGNNKPNSVRYIVEAKIGGSQQYAIVGVSKSQRFKHLGVTPGIPYQYRVQAQAARGSISDWSNEAMVYRL
jgi:hypothetical protein